LRFFIRDHRGISGEAMHERIQLTLLSSIIVSPWINLVGQYLRSRRCGQANCRYTLPDTLLSKILCIPSLAMTVLMKGSLLRWHQITAVFSGIRLLNDGISVEIFCQEEQDIAALGAKLFCEDSQGNRLMRDLEFNVTKTAFVPTSAFPRRLVVVLFSKVNHELVDERVFDAAIPFRPTDLTIEEVEQNVENLIAGGESDSVEFKSQIPHETGGDSCYCGGFRESKRG
jgi:hypothetical protein